MTIVPDDKDWTWVLSERCPECGFDASVVPFAHVPRLLRENAAAWPALLRSTDAAVRPDASTWSTLEYAAHVRDVCRVMSERLALILAEDAPVFANWDQDATAVAERYHEQDPATVAVELVAAAEEAASAFGAVGPEQLDRVGTRSNGSVFTVETLGIYFLHDPIHHLADVTAHRSTVE
ncbi:DinB family protein [Marisediminicola sp. LYQ134]|uniref:DinB family protein n=1 Tax=Marisediminicola sp. LYQ134 TaxID=3391061 RepID=UPI003983BE24